MRYDQEEVFRYYERKERQPNLLEIIKMWGKKQKNLAETMEGVN